MVAKLGSLTQRVQSLSSASTLVYSQLSLLQLSKAAASGQYIHMHTYTCMVHLTISVAGSTHAYVHMYIDANLRSSWPHGHQWTVQHMAQQIMQPPAAACWAEVVNVVLTLPVLQCSCSGAVVPVQAPQIRTLGS